jgi:hypothetical protein
MLHHHTVASRKRRLKPLVALCIILLSGLYALSARAALPTTVTNQGLALDRGASKIISHNQLQVSKGDTAPDQLFYFVEQAPASGVLKRSGVALGVGSSFTQYDVDQGRLSYTHNGGASSSDSFNFSVRSTERISISSDGVQANASAQCISFSDDGRYAVFYSKANNLVSNDTNNAEDVFLRDRQTNTTSLISVSSNGVQGNRKSLCSSITRDGRYIVFQSDATNLVPDDTNGVTDIFVRDRLTSTTTRVSLSSSGEQSSQRSYGASITTDGRYVSFNSFDDSLVAGDTNNAADVFVRDRTQNTTARVSLGSDGAQANGTSYGNISHDGSAVVIHSYATNLVPNDTNLNCDLDDDGVRDDNCPDIFVRDLQADTTTRVSISSTGAQGNSGAYEAFISGNGRFIVFQSFANTLISSDTNGSEDVFVHDRQTRQTHRVSVASGGVQVVGNSYHPAIANDGRYIAFASSSDQLVESDTNGFSDVFIHDRVSNTTRLASVASSGAVSNQGAGEPYISSSGRLLGFQSDSSNLMDGAVSQCDLDNNGSLESVCPHLYVHDTSLFGSFKIKIGSGTPAIGAIADRTILENTSTGPIPLAISDQDTAAENLTITASSSNTLLVPNENIRIGGSGANRTIDVQPLRTNVRSAPTSNPNGSSATITIQVSDGSATSSASFVVTVTPPPWLVMLYVSADDTEPTNGYRFMSLNKSARKLLTELHTMPYNPHMRLVVLYDGNAARNGTTGDSRVFVRDPGGLKDVTQLLSAPGSAWPGFPNDSELDTGSVATLRSFIVWATETYSDSPRTFLSLLDHGGGWAPDINDPPGQPRNIGRVQAGGWRGMNLDYNDGTSLSTRGTSQALRDLGTFDVLFFDACLMGMIESAYEVRDAADYFIAGENLLFADYPYIDYLDKNALTTSTSPRDLALRIVDQYNARIDAREHPYTIAAIDLRRLRETQPNNAAMRVNELAARILAALPASPVPLDNPTRAALTRIYAQSQKFDYDSSQTLDPTEGYVDLADFAKRLSDSQDPAIPSDVRQAAANVFSAIVGPGETQLVIRQRKVNGVYNTQPWTFDGAYGLSIFLPLGEQDYRPTRVDVNNGPAQPEAQLKYYVDSNQLAFTRNVPNWAALLQRLEANTPMRSANGTVGGTGIESVSQRPFNAPFPVRVDVQLVYVPVVNN